MTDRSWPSMVENSAENFGKNDSEFHTFSRQKRPFFAVFALGDPLHDLGVFCGVFYSILGTWGSWIGPKSLRIQKFASGTLNYFACFDGFAGLEMQF